MSAPLDLAIYLAAIVLVIAGFVLMLDGALESLNERLP